MTNAEKIKLLSTKKLLELYNKLTGKTIKRFASREAGEKQTLAAQTATVKKPNAVVVKVTKEKTTQGRPMTDFKIKLSQGTTAVRGSSLRGQILTHMGMDISIKQFTLSSLIEKFGKPARGAIQKLAETSWVKRIDE